MGFVIYATIAIMYICFKVAWELTELMVKLIIFGVTLCFGKPRWPRF
jgi:hypothetical protein